MNLNGDQNRQLTEELLKACYLSAVNILIRKELRKNCLERLCLPAQIDVVSSKVTPGINAILVGYRCHLFDDFLLRSVSYVYLFFVSKVVLNNVDGLLYFHDGVGITLFHTIY